MSDTARWALPLLEAGQAQKEMTVNEALTALDLLAGSMETILDAAVRVDADALVVQGRFLQERFGRAPSDPSTSPGPGLG